MLTKFFTPINDIVWGVPMIILILGTGFYLTFGLRFLSIRKIPYAFRMMWTHRTKDDSSTGQISPFNALMTALAATVGTGNIAGVATAIFVGGPGALFWMWMTALVGMATKFAETVLAVQYRETTPAGEVVGGAMYCIKNGLGKNWRWLGFLFALFGSLCGFGIGNMTQTNSIAEALNSSFSIDPTYTAIVLFILVGAVLLGGLTRIGSVAGKIVPFMAFFYIVVSLVVICMNISEVPTVFGTVIKEAFTGTAAVGGFAGSTIMIAMQKGVARGIFSNEAGLGSAAIAHAAATTKNPVTMGYIGMLGTFIDTIIVCSMTGFAILVTNTWTGDVNGAALTAKAFETALPGWGAYLVAISLAMFAFTTILGWCVYSERCVIYLFGDKGLKPFRFLFTLVVPLGAVTHLDTVWLIADTLNALMAIPNLLMLLLLSPVLFKLVKNYNESAPDVEAAKKDIMGEYPSEMNELK
ncbi:MAG: sodium:alanine symporter family protein [Mailhella sp.]|nr:sodium:alanine symporter family protein [Mailhella sp.]